MNPVVPVVLPSGAVAISTTGSGPVLVLVHGMGSSHRSWHHVADALAPTRRVLAVDMPGFGRSPAAHDGFRPAAVARTIAEAIEASGVEQFDLVGHSLGGMVCAHLADRYPERVRRLVLVAPAGLEPRLHLPGNLAGRLIGSLITLRRELGGYVVAHAMARALMFSQVVHDTAALSESDARIVLEASRGATRIPHGVQAALHGDIRPLLRRLTMPVGLIWGATDRLLPATGIAEAEAARPGIPVRVLAACGHLPMLEWPRELTATIEALLGEPPLP